MLERREEYQMFERCTSENFHLQHDNQPYATRIEDVRERGCSRVERVERGCSRGAARV